MARTSAAEAATRNTERLSVNISTATAQALRHLAASKATSVTEVIRRAVAVLKLLEEEQDLGTEIHLVRKSEEATRVLHLV